ncbi:hypothetical protein MJH12_05670 [bacterium]|nr:hypothetical protein [bacterium]
MKSLFFLHSFILLSILTINHAESDIFADFENRYKEIDSHQEKKQQEAKNIALPNIGVLDLKLVLLLNPAMKDYNFDVHSFIKPIPKNLSVPINFYLKNRIKESKDMVLKSKRRYKDLLEEQLNLQQKISSLIFQNTNEVRYIMSSNRSDTEQKLEEYRSQYQKKLKRYQLRKLGINRDIRETFVSSFGIHYMSPAQRDKALNKIEKEVFWAAKKVLKAKNLSVLLNGNYLKNVNRQDVSQLAWTKSSFSGANALHFYLQRQHQVIDDQIQAYSNQSGGELFKPFYKNLVKVPSIFGKNYFNQFILLGGDNITKATLQVLYKKYNKLNVVKDILNFIQYIKENPYE